MLDPQLLRQHAKDVARQLRTRGFQFDADAFLQLEEQRKSLQIAAQKLQQERNERSSELGLAKMRGEDISAHKQELAQLGDDLALQKSQLDSVLEKITAISYTLPNLPHSSAPIGTSEADNVELRHHGTPRKFDFVPQAHDDLGQALGQMDFGLAAKITGSRFVVMKAQLAKLHRALIQFMLNTHTNEHGYEEVYVPYIVNADSLYGTGQLPKFAADLFKLAGDSDYYLTSTAEIPVTNIVRDTIVADQLLPIRYVCHSPCFRSEAGSYGRDTKGMIRQHQFEKVELVWITTPEESYAALESLTHHAEVILQKLNLPYRVVTLCTADLGGSAAKTYDLEVWLPSQNMYREISSCSNMESYQARRMQARYRTATNDIQLLHTLNGSGLAVGRTLVAIMENYQDKQGNIEIPEVLREYMGGLEAIPSK